MSLPRLEDVFKLSGIPTYTFVRPREYDRLLVALRTPGRGVVIEGPSGIGKTTAVSRALDELGRASDVLQVSARKAEDRALISELPSMRDIGVVLIDDFHRLDSATRHSIADLLKTLADEERNDAKLIVLGINKAGETLITFARDLVNRIDVIPFEANDSDKVRELIAAGQDALQIGLDIADDIVSAAHGSFYLAQMLCHETCLQAGVLERQDSFGPVNGSYELIKERVLRRLDQSFGGIAHRFAHGKKLRREGRAPYLHMLKWLAEAHEWSIYLAREMDSHPNLKASVGQVLEKGSLEELIADDPDIASVLHFEPEPGILSVEDPQFVYYIRNISWPQFAAQVGYVNIELSAPYDIALSFAGSDRPIAERLFELLSGFELNVFYDKNERYRILAEDIEEYLGPIYRSGAEFVVCLLGPEYPKRIWTKFESDQFRERFGSGRVIPIWFSTALPGLFDESVRVGGYMFDPNNDHEPQLQEVADLIRRKLGEHKAQAAEK